MVFLVIIRSAEGQFDIFINIKNIKIKAQQNKQNVFGEKY
jgi:hypothetical protein